MHQHSQPIALKGVEQYIQQIQSLRIGHDAHAQQDCVCREKAAHGGKGQMTVPIYIRNSAHGDSILRFQMMLPVPSVDKGKTVPALVTRWYQYSRKMSMDKRKDGQK